MCFYKIVFTEFLKNDKIPRGAVDNTPEQNAIGEPIVGEARAFVAGDSDNIYTRRRLQDNGLCTDEEKYLRVIWVIGFKMLGSLYFIYLFVKKTKKKTNFLGGNRKNRKFLLGRYNSSESSWPTFLVDDKHASDLRKRSENFGNLQIARFFAWRAVSQSVRCY